MGDFRIKYGSAIGALNNFYARTDNLFTSGDTTPDVTNGCLFYTLNTSTTTITHFDLTNVSASGNVSGHFEGKLIKVIFLDTATTITPSGRMILQSDSSNTFRVNSSSDFVYHNSAWLEFSRSAPYGVEVTTQLLSGASDALNVLNNTRLVIVNGASATNIIQSISGGYIGQVIRLVHIGSNTAKLSSAGNLSLGSDAIPLASSAYTISLTRISNFWVADLSKAWGAVL